MTPDVPFLDLRPARRELGQGLDLALARVLSSGRYLLGRELENLEVEFAAHSGSRHCVGVASGTSAIELTLRAAGVGPGDEVIVPAYTAFATWLAVSRAGAEPIGVDVEAGTCNLDPAALAAATGERTAAVVPVHLRGQPADMESIAAHAAAHGLLLVEDSAQAHGARLGGRRVGTLGDAAAFSFYPTKNLGGIGDGGAVTTDDGQLAERVRRLRNLGMRGRGEIEEGGLCARLAEPQAAALRVALPFLDRWNRARVARAGLYREALAGREAVELPAVLAGREPVWHLFAVGLRDRDAVAAALAARGIETLVHYPLLPHEAGPYRDRWPSGSFPVAERQRRRSLSLPLYPQLDPVACERVAATLLEAVGTAGPT